MMSRRHPYIKPEDRYPDNPVPWPYLRHKHAAKELGVSMDFLDGLANNPIRACKRPGVTGTLQWLFNAEDVAALVEKMTRGRES